MILAIDQGTTGTTCLLVDEELRVEGRGYRELPQHFPRPGWVEHDPEEIWESVLGAAQDAGFGGGTVAITNQRETTLLWERASGRAVAPAIVWQDRRTDDRCRELDRDLIRERTGLVPDPYFSATKLEWLLRGRDPAGLAFGTVDSWLVWKLTRGRQHVIDRDERLADDALLLATLDWDPELLALFGVDRSLLPRIVGSDELARRGRAAREAVPIARDRGRPAGGALRPGVPRGGRGEGDLRHRQLRARAHRRGLLAPAARAPAPPRRRRRLRARGSRARRRCGGPVAPDGLGLIATRRETEQIAQSVPDTGGVYFVPALTGLGSPWWDAGAAARDGLTRGTTRAQLVRATLEAIAHQVADVVEALPTPPRVLRADGGAAQNRFLMQFQADLLGSPLEVAAERETTALGAAALAAGRRAPAPAAAVFEPRRSGDEVAALRAGWHAAVNRSRS